MRLDDLIPVPREQSRAAIEGCSDLEELLPLFQEADNCVRDLRDDIECFRHAGTANADWLRRAGSRMASSMKIRRWCVGRIVDLGGEVPWPASDPRKRQIDLLERRCRLLSSVLRDHDIPVPGRELAE